MEETLKYLVKKLCLPLLVVNIITKIGLPCLLPLKYAGSSVAFACENSFPLAFFKRAAVVLLKVWF